MSVSKCLYVSPSSFLSFPISFYLFSFSDLALSVCLSLCLCLLSVSVSVCLSLNVSLTIGGEGEGLEQQTAQPHFLTLHNFLHLAYTKSVSLCLYLSLARRQPHFQNCIYVRV